MDWAQTLASYCPNLEYIYLRGCKMPILAYPLFSKITEVNLINCNPDMTMTQVAQVLRACPHVVQLKICADFSVVEAGALAEAVKEVKIERICMCLRSTPPSPPLLHLLRRGGGATAASKLFAMPDPAGLRPCRLDSRA